MKISQNNLDNTNTTEVQEGPKLRNIHDVAEVPDEKPEGVDIRLKAAVVVILILIAFVTIKGVIIKASLSSQLNEANKAYNDAYVEALKLGITEDEDGDLIIPEITGSVNVSDLEWDSIESRNETILNEFIKLTLNWNGQSGYEANRLTLINEWGFAENSKLLSSFMPPMNGEINASMSCRFRDESTGKHKDCEVYVLNNDGKTIEYFLICKVRETIGDTPATGTVGIRITINEDGTISKVSAQIIS